MEQIKFDFDQVIEKTFMEIEREKAKEWRKWWKETNGVLTLKEREWIDEKRNKQSFIIQSFIIKNNG